MFVNAFNNFMAAKEQRIRSILASNADAPRPPKLAIITVGDNPASAAYVRRKQAACEKYGVECVVHNFGDKIDASSLSKNIDIICNKPDQDAVILQLPLPQQLDKHTVYELCRQIPPELDVDCLYSIDPGYKGFLAPLTPSAIYQFMCYLKAHNEYDFTGKHIVLVGRGPLVGRPLMNMLTFTTSYFNATITQCHSYTSDLAYICRGADFIVSAVGKAGLITADMVKPGAVIIDAGFARTPEGKPCGDVDYAEVSKVADYVTPVPGGVGPLTVLQLVHAVVRQWGYRVHPYSGPISPKD